MCILKSVRLAGLNFDPMSMWECVNFSFLASGLHCRVVSSVLSRLLRDVRRFEPDGDSKLCILFGLAISIAQERVCIPTGTRTLE